MFRGPNGVGTRLLHWESWITRLLLISMPVMLHVVVLARVLLRIASMDCDSTSLLLKARFRMRNKLLMAGTNPAPKSHIRL